MEKSKQFNLWYLIGAVLAVMLLQDLLAAWSQTAAISYNEFESLLRERKLDNLVVTETMIRGELKDGTGKVFVTARVDPGLAGELDRYGVTYSGGVLLYLNHAIPFRRALWHACVILGAAGHYGAVLVGLVL